MRPLAGPVVPLTVTTGNADQLLGGAGTRPIYGDATATDVLVKGEPVNAPRGRADDFNWQGGESNGAAPAAQTPGPAAAATGAPRADRRPRCGRSSRASANAPETKARRQARAASSRRPAANAKPVPPAPVHHNPPPPPHGARRLPRSHPLGWLR